MVERDGISGQVREIVVFLGFPRSPSVSGLESPKLCWLDGWKMVDDTEFKRRDVFQRISEDPSVSGLKYTKFIVTSEQWGSEKKRVFGISYSGANIGEVLDMLAELAKPMRRL